MTLPPGQHDAGRFLRYGTHLWHAPPPVPEQPQLEVTGALDEPLAIALADLAAMPRREQVNDFHCVAGWSATGLRWEGVPFAAFWHEVVEPRLGTRTAVTHLGFRGLDRYRAVVLLEDALQDDVLLADRLNGAPLDADHGAPLRLVTPSQYGYMNTKHLCRIEVHCGEPESDYGHLDPLSRTFVRYALAPHPRARVQLEERHRSLPASVVRPLYYRVLHPPFRRLCDR